MLQLTESQLDSAFSAIQFHGYGSFFPLPPELPIIDKEWAMIRQELANHDIDTYNCYEALNAFVPKSRLNVRLVSLLHPFDLLYYTGLVMAIRDDIAAARMSLHSQRVFSFRSEKASANMLYSSKPGYREFRSRQRKKAQAKSCRFVGVADIADFYPRIYQHRLNNALLAALTDSHKRNFVRGIEKLLNQFSGNTSYGVPVGPAASRPLAEAVLIDVDSALKTYDIDFVRFVDDFVIFGRTYEAVESSLHFLGETLFTQHGWTLQTAKSNIYTSKDFLKSHLAEHSEHEEERRKLIEIMMGEEYEERSYSELNEDEQSAIDAFNLTEMLEEALSPTKVVDYSEVGFILGRLSSLKQPDLIPIVLRNIQRLYPVANSVAAFFQGFDALGSKDKKRIASRLMAPILNSHKPAPPVYYMIWILHLFHENPSWNHADDLLKVFRGSQSPIVKRYAALALSSSGSRAHAFALKDYYRSAPPLLKTAILLASGRLGSDERKYWIRSLRLSDPLEKLVATSCT